MNTSDCINCIYAKDFNKKDTTIFCKKFEMRFGCFYSCSSLKFKIRT